MKVYFAAPLKDILKQEQGRCRKQKQKPQKSGKERLENRVTRNLFLPKFWIQNKYVSTHDSDIILFEYNFHYQNIRSKILLISHLVLTEIFFLDVV